MDRYDDTLTLGVEAMDTEHRHLAALFEAFSAAVKHGSAPEQIQQIVQKALVATNEHFAHEEELMVQNAYPAIEEEKLNHRNLRLKLTTLVGTTVAMPARDQVMLENLADMQRMLFEHITGPDRDLAIYLNAHGVH